MVVYWVVMDKVRVVTGEQDIKQRAHYIIQLVVETCRMVSLTEVACNSPERLLIQSKQFQLSQEQCVVNHIKSSR